MDRSIRVTMLGKFTIYGPGLPRPRVISLSGRSRRLWILVAYLIVHRERGVPAQELIDWLWPEAEGINPMSTLQNNISRARNALEELGLEDGKRLIYNNTGTYFWAPDRETMVDFERFDALAAQAMECPDGAAAPDLAMQAAALYTCDLLPECAGEEWRDTPCQQLRQRYEDLTVFGAQGLTESGRYRDAQKLCLDARKWLPESQKIASLAMLSLRLDGQAKQALQFYDEVCEGLKGAALDPELELEREEAQAALSAAPDDGSRILHALVGSEGRGTGATRCDNTVFREFVRRQLRDLRRGGQAQLLSFRLDCQDPALRAQAMQKMETVLSGALRGGDPFTRRGLDLFLVLLPGATRENGETVAKRILDRYEAETPEAEFTCQVLDLNSEEVEEA